MRGSEHALGLRDVAILSRLVAVCFAAALVLVSGCSGPAAQNEGVKWSHSELISHLKKKGLTFTATETPEGFFWGPAMYFDFGSEGKVYVQVRKTEQEAKDAAGPKGEEAFSWGRFYFEGEPKLLAKVKQTLQKNKNRP